MANKVSKAKIYFWPLRKLGYRRARPKKAKNPYRVLALALLA